MALESVSSAPPEENIERVAKALGIKPAEVTVTILDRPRHEELVKSVHHRAEEGRVAVRNVRRHHKDELEKLQRDGGISEDDLLKQGLRSFLERQLREVKAQIFEISGRYGVSSVTEMEARYRDGTLEEADSWRVLQRLDHIEHKRDCVLRLLEVVV